MALTSCFGDGLQGQDKVEVYPDRTTIKTNIRVRARKGQFVQRGPAIRKARLRGIYGGLN